MRGRHTSYTPALAAEICARVAQGETLASLADQPGMPGKRTMYNWRDRVPAFRAAYAEACASRPRRRQRRWADSPGPPGEPRPPGHPPSITPDVADRIMDRISHGAGWRDLAADRSLPAPQTILNRIRADAEFRRRYQVSCEERAELLAYEATLIADDLSGEVSRDRLRVELRKWRVQRMELRAHAAPAGGEAPAELTYEERLRLLK